MHELGVPGCKAYTALEPAVKLISICSILDIGAASIIPGGGLMPGGVTVLLHVAADCGGQALNAVIPCRKVSAGCVSRLSAFVEKQ